MPTVVDGALVGTAVVDANSAGSLRDTSGSDVTAIVVDGATDGWLDAHAGTNANANANTIPAIRRLLM